MRRWVLAWAAIFVAAGCIQPEPAVYEGEVYGSLWLEYTLIDTRADQSDARHANPGPHCGETEGERDRLRISTRALDRAGSDRPILIAKGKLEGSWVTLGTGTYVRGLPTDVPTGIRDEARIVGNISWGPGPTVDGRLVLLPHTWTVVDRADEWRVEARLERGPESWGTFRPGMCM